MSKFTGNIIRLPAVTPTQNSASGVYTLDDQFTAQSSGTWPIVRDQYFNYTTLLLTGAVQGTAYPNPVTQPYSFLSDASTNNFVVSPNGDVSARPFNPYLNNYSNRFDGSSGQLAFPTGSFVFGNSDFTIEAWVYNTGTTTGTFFNNQYTSGASTTSIIGAIGSASANFDMYVGSSIYSLTGINPALNQWVHLAIVRTGGTVSVFQNGTRTNTRSDLSTLSINAGGTTVAPQIGNGVNGYISNHRIIIGSGPYDATQTSITVPTVPLTAITNTKLLTCQANRFIDTNTQVAAKTITVTGTPAVAQNSPFVSYDTTNGSGYFDGTGDFLQVANNAAFGSLNGVDYTIEFWAYLTTISGDQPLLACTAIGASGFAVWSLSGQLTAFFGSGTTITGSTLIANQWNHIAIVRTSTNTQLYLNGTTQGTPSTSAFGNNTTQPLMIGGLTTTTGWNSDRYATAYITGVRIIKSQALATGNFTPPTTPPTITTVGWTGGNVPTQSITGTVSIYTLQTRAPATNNGFIDSSPNNFVVTRNGNTTQGSFSPFSPTGWGNYFAGSQSISIAATAALQYSGDFTIECWFYKQATGDTSTFVQQSTNYFALNVNPGTGINIYLNSASANFVITDRVPQINTWHHIALVRSGSGSGNIKCYLDGVASSTTATNTSTLGYNAIGYLGALGTQSAGSWVGYISNFRIVSGRAVYTSNFTPPALPLTRTTGGTNPPQGSETIWLTAQSNRFLDSNGVNTPASSPLTITVNGSPSVQAFSPFAPAQSYIPSQIGGSGYFDGTTDYLSVPSNPVFAMGTGDFTIEFWFYPLVYSGSQNLVSHQYTTGFAIGTQTSTGTLEFYIANAFISTTTRPTLNAWNHVVCQRTSGTAQIYINGVQVQSGSLTGNATSTTALVVAAAVHNLPNETSNGHISGLRIIKGTAVYSGTTYTVPTAPPTAIPNTSLLLNFTNGGIVDATGKNNLETVGNSGVQTSQAKWSPGSMYFDGNGDYIPQYGLLLPITGDFTVEAWIRVDSLSAIRTIFGCGSAGTKLAFYVGTSGLVGVQTGSGYLESAGSLIATNTWYHVALTRTSNTYKIFVDGTERTLSGAGTMLTTISNSPQVVGAFSDTFGGSPFSGYMDDFRISMFRRYTSNFTAPTAPFPLG